jgi:cyanophycinase
VTGTLALVGGGEFTDGCADLDRMLLERAGSNEVVVLPTARAYEHPDRTVADAAKWFEALGATVQGVRVLRRTDAEAADAVASVRDASFIYLTDGSPLHLRSVLKESSLFAALRAAFDGGAVVAASGAGATVLCDPMVDPRGGAYTVGLGVVRGLAVFPYHGTAAEHLRARSSELLPVNAILAGIDERTALVRERDGDWQVIGPGRVALSTRDGTIGTFRAESIAALSGL